MALAVLAWVATPALGAVGDWWILPIDRLDNEGSFITHAGMGYDGTDAKEGSGIDGVRRVWWNTQNVYESSGGAMPTGLKERPGATNGGNETKGAAGLFLLLWPGPAAACSSPGGVRRQVGAPRQGTNPQPMRGFGGQLKCQMMPHSESESRSLWWSACSWTSNRHPSGIRTT